MARTSKLVHVGVMLPRTLRDKLQGKAKAKRLSLSALIREMIWMQQVSEDIMERTNKNDSEEKSEN